MFIIFGFSSQNAIESKGISTKISEYVLKFNKTYQQANQKEKASMLKRTNAIMRKVAHFSIYTVLGISSFETCDLIISNNAKRSYSPIRLLPVKPQLKRNLPLDKTGLIVSKNSSSEKLHAREPEGKYP